MSGRVGRDQSSRRDHHHHHHQHNHFRQQRFDDSKPASRGGKTPNTNPPSRHLWVGNLSHHISETTLTDHFIRFGELENIIYHPGRSYAFVNFLREDDALAAFNSLQGFSLQGSSLRIEFAKSDKSSAPSLDELHSHHRDELQHPTSRSSAYSPRESRKHHASSDTYFSDSTRTNERSSDHPTEILWIGFPSFLKVDDSILRKAFSPFGDIEKITAFPGRTYAFVQFRNVSSARRAKETLQGKLFGNPRVHISFARKDHASSDTGRRTMGPNDTHSPYFKSTSHVGSSDYLRPDRNVRGSTEDPRDKTTYFPGLEYGGPEIKSSSRKESSWTRSGLYEERERRLDERGLGVVPPEELQEYRVSPYRDRSVHYNEFSPPKFQRTSTFQEVQWDLPEDTYSYHGAKKLKIDSFSHETELPDYPLHNSEHDKHYATGFVPELHVSDQLRAPIPYRRLADNSSSYNRSLGGGNDDNWRSSHDTFQAPLAMSSSIPVELRRTTPDGQKEWKWEGTIAKGGTPVCRARCFPVGKVMDISLPEFLDCTARTGLDMLAKHYYQAACSWVVFFVAASDADMGYYNEFMHYLGDKQRAAVAKLDDMNTLFLVPPSEFSQNVLKVPGKLSISGVVLSLEPCSPGLAPRLPANEIKDQNLIYSHENNTSYAKMEMSSGSSSIPVSHSNLENSGVNYNAPLQGNVKSSAPSLSPGFAHGSGSTLPYHMENRHDIQPGNVVSRDFTSHAFPQISEGFYNNKPISGRGGPELARFIYDGMTSYSGGGTNLLSVQDLKIQSSVPLHMGNLQQEQHADLSSSIHGPQRQTVNSGPPPPSEAFRASGLIENQAESLSRVPPGYGAPQTNQGTLPSLLGQQMVQAENGRALFTHGALPVGTNQDHGQGQGQVQSQVGNQEIANMSNAAQDDNEADPQKRLQATLQLAAALLHQIQGKGN